MLRPLSLPFVLAASLCAALPAQDRAVAEILRDFDRLHSPGRSRDGSKEAQDEFRRAVREIASKKAALAAELDETHPDHARVAELLGSRWALMINSLDRPGDVRAEVEARLADDGLRADVRREALLGRARALVAMSASTDDCLKAATAFAAVDPEATETGHLILEVLFRHDVAPSRAAKLVAVVRENWSDDRWLGPRSKGYEQQLARVGAPHELAFDDLLGGGAVDATDGSARHTLCVYWSSIVPAEAAEVTETAAARGDLRVLGVVNYRMKGGAEAVTAALRTAGVEWPHCYDEPRIQNPFESPYRTPRTPFYYLLDGEGRVVRFAYGWDVMKQILAKLPKPDGL